MHIEFGASTLASYTGGMGSRRGVTAVAETISTMDTVSISEQARALASAASAASTLSPLSSTENDLSTVATGSRLNKYLDLGLGEGDTSLMALNFSRKNLGGRIDSLIKKAGVSLSPDEKLAIAVDNDGNITVGGLKDTKKAKQIEEALNKDKRLGREMKRHAAAGKVNESVKKLQAYEGFMRENGISPDSLADDLDELFTNAGVRAFIIDEYLQTSAGISLADLHLEDDGNGGQHIHGINSNDALSALLFDDPDLKATVEKILATDPAKTTFSASFEFANGTISDSVTAKAADAKLADIKDRIMGYWDAEAGDMIPGVLEVFMDKLEAVGGEYDEGFMKALARGFSIQVDVSGTITIVGLDDLNPRLVDTLKDLAQQAINEWAEEASPDGNPRLASLADVAEAYIEQHRFEHGDVDEHKHILEINFGGVGSNGDPRVVSPDADAARDRQNQELAGELGEQLRLMLGEEGLDVDGLEMDIDENGVIRIQGDPRDPDVQKAQMILDQFTRTAKTVGGTTPEREDASDAFDDRWKVLSGEEDGDPQEWFKSKVALAGDENGAGDPREWSRTELMAAAWENVFPANESGRHFMSGVGPVSAISPWTPVTDFSLSPESRAGDKAIALYNELRAGMGQFHDERRTMRYGLRG